MYKKGGVWFVLGIIFIVILLIVVATGIYFYNFHVFKTMRVCVTENFQDTNLVCSSDEYCVETFKNNSTEIKDNLEQTPDFMKEKITEVSEAAIFCDSTCKIKEIRGFENDGLQEIEFCNSDEQEIKFEIRGKEGLKILLWLRKQGEI